jgi:hypothetical protein
MTRSKLYLLFTPFVVTAISTIALSAVDSARPQAHAVSATAVQETLAVTDDFVMPASPEQIASALAELHLPPPAPPAPVEPSFSGGRIPGSSIVWKAEQLHNAYVIMKVGCDMGMSHAWVVALSTALQESMLYNLGHLGAKNDHDSLGLFQQRPSAGWGTPSQVTDPVYAARKFYQALKTVPGWERMTVTGAAQAVQRSAYPGAYQKHVGTAKALVTHLRHRTAC